MELEQLRIFTALCEEGGFSAAALLKEAEELEKRVKEE